MIWVLAGLVVYLVVSVWVLQRSFALEAKIMRAQLILLWRRVEKIDGDAVPVSEVYEELKKLGVKHSIAWYYSGGYDAAMKNLEDDDDEEGGTP